MFTKSQHAAWHHVLGLCKLGEGETVIVLGAQGVDTRYRDIALQVGRELGATAAYIEVENANVLPAGTSITARPRRGSSRRRGRGSSGSMAGSTRRRCSARSS